LAAITPLGTRLYRLVSHHRRSAWRLLNALRGQPIHVGIRLKQACAATVIGLMLSSDIRFWSRIASLNRLTG
jgi:hypothetical protein